MMYGKFALLCALLFTFVFTSEHAQANNTFPVKKSDGTIGQYQLLPILSHDPDHAAVVEERLKEDKTPRADLPKEHYISKAILPPVRDQLDRGTCVYFATIGLMENYLIKQDANNKALRLSEECIVNVRNWMHDSKTYNLDDKPIGYRPDPDGEYPNLVIKSIDYYGVPLAKKYPHAECRYPNGGESGLPLDTYLDIFSSGQSPAYGKGHPFDYDSAPTITKIKELLARDIPVEVAILVYVDYFTTSSWYYKSMRDTDAKLAGGHAIQLVGYRSTGKGDQTMFVFKNSWGIWGNQGYGYIDDKLLKHSWKYDPEYDLIISYHD
jgi:hypothetical protein